MRVHEVGVIPTDLHRLSVRFFAETGSSFSLSVPSEKRCKGPAFREEAARLFDAASGAMNMKRKLVVVGGGSQFAVELTESLVDYARDRLAGTEVVLLDIHERHLQTVTRFASSLAQSTGVDMKFSGTTDRARAFEGADYILTTFRPGSHQQTEQDESVPPKYGLQGNETVSIGGIFMACRVVPLLKQICADAERICPRAWILNYTNPTQYVADAVRRISNMRIISLCDGFLDDREALAKLLGVNSGDIVLYPAGSNHCMWIKRFTVKGEEGYPLLEARLRELGDKEIERIFAKPDRFKFMGLDIQTKDAYPQFVPNSSYPFSLKLHQIYGMLPSPRYYTRYHYDQDAVLKEERGGNYVTMAGFYIKQAVPKMFDGLDQRLERTARKFSTERTRGGGSHGDMAVRVVEAMANDTGEIFDVNVPNRGAISNLPDDSIVEIAAALDRTGPHPFAVGPLPKAVLGYQYSLVLAQELAVDAALSGSRNDLLKAILAHPLIHSVEAAEGAMDELLRLQSDWLPQFRH
jgi:6-phospho-beta-glucosidase